MERKLIEICQPSFQGWVCGQCGHVFVTLDCVIAGLTLGETIRDYKIMREQAFAKHMCLSLSENQGSVQD